jgi:hypothetical protein
MGDMRTCFLDKRTKLTAARTCTPGAPNQCGDTIMDECGCAIAVNDADSAEAQCFLRSVEEQPCGYCFDPCMPPAGECEFSSPDLAVCR